MSNPAGMETLFPLQQRRSG